MGQEAFLLGAGFIVNNIRRLWGWRSSFFVGYVVVILFIPHKVDAAPTMIGQTGMVNMPNARIAEDGVLRFGLSQFDPYTTFWSSLSMFPRLELGARYTSIEDTVALSSNYGTFKDKAFDAKLLLLNETQYLPALSIGTQDFLGTRVFDADFITLSKRFGEFDLSLGYGRNRIDGYFGGIEYRPKWAKGFDFSYEYDAVDYRNDRFSSLSGANDRRGGSTASIGYRYGWLGASVAYQRGGNYGANVYVSIPLMQREFIPKLHEPAPFTEKTKRITAQEWDANPIFREDLVNALEVQGFRNVQLLLVGNQLEIGLAHRRISLIGRSVGRAVRTALLMGPSDASSIRVTYFTLTDLALVTYHFHDLPLLARFFEGKATYGELLQGLTVSYASPETAQDLFSAPVIERENEQKKPPVTNNINRLQWVPNEEGHAISLRREDESLGRIRIIPFNMGIYFNDANGAFRYETFALAKYLRYLRRGLFFDSSVRLRLLEDVSRVTDTSNSTLPHVRTDIGDYKRDSNFKLNNLLLNQYLHLRPRVYARLSLGYYEEMYGGAGGQVLYFPKQFPWAVDLSVDYLKQRSTVGDFGFRKYETTTAIAALHYRLPKQGLTFTLRGGRFLAKDVGLRYEFRRRFRSGVRIGAWYTVTDGEDITSPGSPDDPYRDKGIFVSIPLGSMLTKDTRATARFAISPWTRDVGQMVKSPGDLYTILEDPLMFDWGEHHLLSGFHQ